MKLLSISFDRPEYNLAFEEHYFNAFEEDTLRLWCNDRSVIVGKHQNAFAEANLHYCQDNDIPIIRRISGGGTVFHDLGNINFSFFRFTENGKQIEYDKNLDIICESLISLGYEVQMNQRHDLVFQGKKVSGNAQHVSKGRALHHGTILYDSQLNALSKSIKNTRTTYIDKSVKSVRSNVVNLRSIKDLGDAKQFMHKLKTGFEPMDNEKKVLDEFDYAVQSNKYFTDEWNFNYGPAYQMQSSIEGINLCLSVERGGQIKAIECPDRALHNKLSGLLDKKHQPKVILEYLRKNFNRNEANKLFRALF